MESAIDRFFSAHNKEYAIQNFTGLDINYKASMWMNELARIGYTLQDWKVNENTDNNFPSRKTTSVTIMMQRDNIPPDGNSFEGAAENIDTEILKARLDSSSIL